MDDMSYTEKALLQKGEFKDSPLLYVANALLRDSGLSADVIFLGKFSRVSTRKMYSNLNQGFFFKPF